MKQPLDVEPNVKHDFMTNGIASHYVTKTGNQPTVVGLRNGIPDGAEQGMYKRRKVQLDPYAVARHPFKSNNMVHLAQPTMYVNQMASTGGTPLSIAMEDMNHLEQFVDSERHRMDPKNPLSAAYALRVLKTIEIDPEKGPMYDAMRRKLLYHWS